MISVLIVKYLAVTSIALGNLEKAAMSKKRIDVTFKPAEFRWVQNNLNRNLSQWLAKAEKSAAIRKGKRFILLQKLTDMFNEEMQVITEQESTRRGKDVNLKLTRAYVKMIIEMAGNILKGLTEKVIPEYNKRITEAETSSEKIKYEGYLTSAKSYEKMIDKIVSNLEKYL